MEVAALVSGGVDSSVIVHLLKEQGITPSIFYIKIAMEDEEGNLDCTYKQDIEIVFALAKKYGCKMEIADLHEEYWNSVVKYTIDTVKSGLTPNPDIMCNKLIKFGTFNEKYGKNFDQIATGHYADTSIFNNQVFLSTAKDHVKDQTYFLGQIDYNQVSKLSFPLGKLLKSQVRQIAHDENLLSADRPDSQGICFLGKINYRDFVKRYLGENEGPIIEFETGKILGNHKGIWFHTIGQRQGLRLGGGPWYVVDKNINENIIFVSKGFDSESQFSTHIYLQNVGFINSDLTGIDLENISFKIRHTPDFTFGSLKKEGELYHIISEEKISGIAPGQFGVIYDKDKRFCLGGGPICIAPVK